MCELEGVGESTQPQMAWGMLGAGEDKVTTGLFSNPESP